MVAGGVSSVGSEKSNTLPSVHWIIWQISKWISFKVTNISQKSFVQHLPTFVSFTSFQKQPLVLKITVNSVSLTTLSSKIVSSTLKVKWQWTFGASISRGKGQLLSEMLYSPALPKFDLKVWSSQRWPTMSWSRLTSFPGGKTTLNYLNIINLAKSK